MYIEMRSIFALFCHCEGVRRASPGQCARTRCHSPGTPGASAGGGTQSHSPKVPGASGELRAALPEFQGHRGDSEPLSGSSGGGHGAPPKPLSEACSQTCGETARVCLHTSSCAPCCEHCVRLVTNKSVESWPVVLQLHRVCGHHVMPQGHGHAQ